MTINGLALPASFVAAIQSGRLNREIGCWELRRERDAFGNHLETELGDVCHSPRAISRVTAQLPKYFVADGYYGAGPGNELTEPGAIPDILDFAKILCFAESGDGAFFCFDYRESPDRPRVIWWDDAYWRVVAPDFDQFLSLFNLDDATRTDNEK